MYMYICIYTCVCIRLSVHMCEGWDVFKTAEAEAVEGGLQLVNLRSTWV